jgi:hypothetical protein
MLNIEKSIKKHTTSANELGCATIAFFPIVPALFLAGSGGNLERLLKRSQCDCISYVETLLDIYFISFRVSFSILSPQASLLQKRKERSTTNTELGARLSWSVFLLLAVPAHRITQIAYYV